MERWETEVNGREGMSRERGEWKGDCLRERAGNGRKRGE